MSLEDLADYLEEAVEKGIITEEETEGALTRADELGVVLI